MKRKWQAEGFAKRGSLKKAGHAATSGGVRLEDIDCASGQHLAEVMGIVPIFAGGDIHAGRPAISQKSESFQVIRTHRLLKPADI